MTDRERLIELLVDSEVFNDVCESKNYGVGAYSDTYRDFFSGQFPVKNVTHWCELPQPPEGVHS